MNLAQKIYPLSEKALCIDWGNIIDEHINSLVASLDKLIRLNPFLGFIETVPAYSTLTIYYQPGLVTGEAKSPFNNVKNYVETLLPAISPAHQGPGNLIEIPVCYDAGFGPDLESVAFTNDLTKKEVIDIHRNKEYKVYMMGFLPGFAYLGQLDDAIATPRKQTPALKVKEGSVGIGGKQTGIYPLDSPGGWQIIGRSPLVLFDPKKENPFLLKTGDRVKFFSINKEEFLQTWSALRKTSPDSKKMGQADVVVIKPGAFSTLQDGGRWGFQSFGLPLSGAMDERAFLLANALAGNSMNEAVIECTMGGLLLQFKKKACIAVTGAGTALVNHRPVKNYQPLTLWAKDLLEIKYNHNGIRTYIAVSGGFAAPALMNSRSSLPLAGIGNILQKEEGVQIESGHSLQSGKIDHSLIMHYSPEPVIRIFEGPEMTWMNKQETEKIYVQKFSVSHQSGRMGIRLNSMPIYVNKGEQLVSSAVTKGTIQLTPDGQLIVLMSDCHTVGGYPRVAQIAAADLPLIAQSKPGDIIRFKKILFPEAEELVLAAQKLLNESFSGH